MIHGTWRDEIRPLVAHRVADGKARGMEGRALYLFVLGCFPWPPAEGHPYAIWRDEARIQAGIRVSRKRCDKPAPLFGG